MKMIKEEVECFKSELENKYDVVLYLNKEKFDEHATEEMIENFFNGTADDNRSKVFVIIKRKDNIKNVKRKYIVQNIPTKGVRKFETKYQILDSDNKILSTVKGEKSNVKKEIQKLYNEGLDKEVKVNVIKVPTSNKEIMLAKQNVSKQNRKGKYVIYYCK